MNIKKIIPYAGGLAVAVGSAFNSFYGDGMMMRQANASMFLDDVMRYCGISQEFISSPVVRDYTAHLPVGALILVPAYITYRFLKEVMGGSIDEKVSV